MKIIVCGGREYDNAALVSKALDGLLVLHKGAITHLIHGGARGADALAHDWALRNGVQTVECVANWHWAKHWAGPRRNTAMLDLKPDLVVAFPGGAGTADMIKRARRVGVTHMEILDEQANS